MKRYIISLLFALPLHGAGFTEPPVVLYGEVVHLGEGSSYHVHDGEMVVTIVNQDDPSDVIFLETNLGRLGSGGAFSYSIEIPQRFLPSAEEKEASLSVNSAEASYRFSSITIDGELAEILDTGQSLLNTSFANRDQQHRLDLLVSLPQVDSDSDGMPDWWEDLYGLNALSAADAASNTDGDTWTALQEFLNGGDPTVDNSVATVSDATILLPSGGIAGLWFPVVGPNSLSFTATNVGSGLSLNSNSFTYADILAGQVTVSATGDFTNSTITLEHGSETSTLNFRALNPTSHSVEQPVTWLQAEEIITAGPVSEWGGSSGDLVAFQPIVSAQPVAAGAEVGFSSNQFLYLNDSSFDLNDFTALALFSVNSTSASDASIFNTSDLNLSIGGSDHAAYAQTLKVTRKGSRIFGPPVSLGAFTQLSLTPDALSLDGTSRFLSQAGGSLKPSFGSIGARQAVTESSASGFFDGQLKELVLYDSQLDAKTLSRLEDYQLSRWQNVTLWDHRTETTPVVISGAATRNSLNGGWGSDTLSGGPLDDILRGGPAADTLTGGAGKDRFQIFLGDGNDEITDFTESDILDLSPLFEGESGIPTDYLTLSSSVEYQAGQAPTTNTVVTASTGEQVTLRGLALSNDDLPRLVGNGTFYLGNLRFESVITLSANDTELTETEYARPLTLTRSGNLDASAEVYLSFVGSAANKADYSISSAIENGVVHKVTFPVDVAQLQVDITPIQDTLPESETIDIAVLPSSAFPGGGSEITFALKDAPQITIESLVQHAQRLGSVPGVIKVSREGELDQPLDVHLAFDGTARNGEDFDQVTPLVSFAANEQSKIINITPAEHALDKGESKVATVSIVPDTTSFATLSPWSASVMILDSVGEGVKSYDSWRASLDPAFNMEGPLQGDSDFLDLFTEYSLGLDPTQADAGTATQVKVFTLDGRFLMEIPTRAGMQDVRLVPERLDGTAWQDDTDRFLHSLYPLSDDRVMHVFTSRQSVSEIDQGGIFRMNMLSADVPALTSVIGPTDETYLVSGETASWIPSWSGVGLAAAAREAGTVSSFSTTIEGSSTVTFDWSAAAGKVEFFIDGVAVASTDATSGRESHTIAGGGSHQLKWTVTYSAADDLAEHAEVKNIDFQ